jgi:hypothetical protein
LVTSTSGFSDDRSMMLSTPVPRRVAHHVVRHRRRKAQQDVGVGDIGIDLAVVADHVDGQLREQLQEPGLVTGLHRLLDFGENEDLRHGR